MDLADARLVRMSEQHDAVLVILDSEFRSVFRRHGRSAIPLSEGSITRSPLKSPR